MIGLCVLLLNTRYHGFKSKSNTDCRAPQDLLVVERRKSGRQNAGPLPNPNQITLNLTRHEQRDPPQTGSE